MAAWDLHSRVISERHAGSAQPMTQAAVCSLLPHASPCSRTYTQRGCHRAPSLCQSARGARHALHAASLETSERSSPAEPADDSSYNQYVREGFYESSLVELQVRQAQWPAPSPFAMIHLAALHTLSFLHTAATQQMHIHTMWNYKFLSR